MFPIRDHNPSQRFQIVTIALIAINVVIHLWVMATITPGRELAIFYFDYGLVPAKIAIDQGYSGYFTSMFLHGDLWHLGGNMLFLWIVGDNIEDELGSIPFAVFYVIAGFAAGWAQYAIDPSSRVPVIGASGAVAGVMGAYLLMFPKARVDVFIFIVVFFRIIPIPAWILLALWFGMQLFGGFGVQSDGGGVAYWAHIGGFLAGLVLMLPVWLYRGGPRYWTVNEGHAPHPEASYSRSDVPIVRRNR